MSAQLAQTLLSVCLGIGLSAGCGFRLFVPPLIVSIAAHCGYLTLGPHFAWIGSTPAMIVFAVATVLEIAAYYLPWVDNLLDVIATPAAVVAGVIMSASIYTDMSPVMTWSLAIIAGGGAAATVQGATATTRAASSATTGGCANPLIATLENFAAFALSIIALVVPVLGAVIFCGLLALAIYKLVTWLERRHRREPEIHLHPTQLRR